MIFEEHDILKGNKRFIFSFIVLLVYMALIFWVSSLPNEQLIPEAKYGLTISQSVKHLGEFGILGILMASVALQVSERFSSIFVSSVFSVSYGVLDEIHQAFVPTRYCTVNDMWVNSIGALLGITFYIIVVKFARMKKVKC